MSRISTALLTVTLLMGCPEKDMDPDVGAVDLTTLDSVLDKRDGGALFSTWNNGPDNAWFVGGTWGKSDVLQWDGTKWTEHDPGFGHQLWWVHGFDSGAVYVSGANGTIGRYTGGEWEQLDSSVDGTLFYGIWGAAEDDMWAVSGEWLANDEIAPKTDIVVHYDGTAWTQVTIEALESKAADADKDLYKVWGADANHVFIVGNGGMALHYDGAEWRKEDTGTTDPLFTVAGRAKDDVYAVGGDVSGLLVHWNGVKWTPLGVGEFAPQRMPGLHTAPGEPVYVSGAFGYVARLTEDGIWQEPDPVHDHGYHAVRSDGAGGVWAVGGDLVSLVPKNGASIALAGRSVPSP